MALVLTRKNGETVYIGDTIKVTVVRCRSCDVRLEIDAPSHMPIGRDAPRSLLDRYNPDPDDVAERR